MRLEVRFNVLPERSTMIARHAMDVMNTLGMDSRLMRSLLPCVSRFPRACSFVCSLDGFGSGALWLALVLWCEPRRPAAAAGVCLPEAAREHNILRLERQLHVGPLARRPGQPIHVAA